MDVTPPGNAAVVLDHLDVSRGHTPVLHDLTLEVPRGAVLGLLGPSGCGKTTLMRTIVGVQRPASGRVTVLGLPAGDRRLRGHIGYVTQQVSAYTDLSVHDNVAYFGALQGAGADAVEEAIAAVDLGDLSRRPVATLSGGQAGRASLACALVGDPELLVLDEPTVGLDPVTREGLWERFRELAASGRTLVVSSHVMDEATRCDLLALMRGGRLLGVWTPGELLRRTGADTPDQAFLALVREGATGTDGTPDGRRDGGAGHAGGAPGPAPAPDDTATPEEGSGR